MDLQTFRSIRGEFFPIFVLSSETPTNQISRFRVKFLIFGKIDVWTLKSTSSYNIFSAIFMCLNPCLPNFKVQGKIFANWRAGFFIKISFLADLYKLRVHVKIFSYSKIVHPIKKPSWTKFQPSEYYIPKLKSVMGSVGCRGIHDFLPTTSPM